MTTAAGFRGVQYVTVDLQLALATAVETSQFRDFNLSVSDIYH